MVLLLFVCARRRRDVIVRALCLIFCFVCVCVCRALV